MVYHDPKTKPYHLLDSVIPLDDDNELFDRLLGLVTENSRQPLSSCRPEAPFKAKDYIQAPKCLYPKKAIECEDVEWLQENNVEEEAKLQLSQFLNLWGSHTKKTANAWSSTLLRRIEIQENARDRIKELLKIPEYERGVRELIQTHSGTGKRRDLAVITGFITCVDMAVNKDDENAIAGGASLEPVSEATTGIPGATVTVQRSVRKTRHQAISGAYKGEVVVACCYLSIFGEVIKSPSRFKSWWPAKSPPSRWQVGEEPVVVQSDDGCARYKIKRKAIKGNLDPPLGANAELPGDGETSQGKEPAGDERDDLRFIIGAAYSVDEDGSE